MERILVIRLTAIGDVVLTLPVVSVLRQNFPDAKISFLTVKENADLLRGFQEVGEAIALDRAVLRGGNPLRAAGELLRLFRRLRAGKFTHAIDLQSNGESAWLARLTGAAQRWGTIHKRSRRWAFTQWLDRETKIHAAEMHLKLLQHCGLKAAEVRNQFVLPADALSAADAFFAKHHLENKKPTLYLQPFTSSSYKNWPMENFLALASHWQARGWQVIFGGGPGDLSSLESVREKGFVVSAGVPLLVTGGLMQKSKLIVGGDTGALHLAVAQGKRVVMLMSHDWPGRPHPFRHPEWSLVPPSGSGIKTISLAAVITACEEALK